jgi:zinc protease
MVQCRRWLFVSVAIGIAFLSGCGLTQQGPSQSSAPKVLFDYRDTKLANGMEVVTLEDFSCPIVAVQVWYHVGSKNERPDRQGYAHMFEHMMFKGTDRVGPKDHFSLINQVGGEVNGYTSFDRTVYVQTLPADQIELALWLEAERMSFLKIDQEAFDTERKVVEEELRMGQNQPYGTLWKKSLAGVFQVHPYRWMPIGQIADLRATSVADLREFWMRNYVPNNTVLVIVGAVPHDKAQQLARKYFEWIKPQPQPEPVRIVEPPLKAAKSITISDENAPAPMVNMVWRTVPTGHPDEARLELLGEILGGGQSSRLYLDLVSKKLWAVGASASSWNLEQDGLLFFQIVLTETADPEQVVAAVKGHIRDIQKSGVTEEEWTKARNQKLKGLVTQNLEIDSKAQVLGVAAVEKGSPARANTLLSEVQSVTRQQIQDAARKYLSEDRVVIFDVKKNDRGMQAGERDKEDMPVAAPETQTPPPGRKGTVRPSDFPAQAPMGQLVKAEPQKKYDQKVLPNGLKVMVVPNKEVPFVSISLGILNGGWTETKPGVANMTLEMLTLGTQRHTDEQLARELETYAISLGGSAGIDSSTVYANCLPENLDRAMTLMAEVVLEPTFPKDPFDRLQKQILTGLAIDSETPQYLADRELRRRLYGNHPYSRTATGEVADVQALTPDDLKGWWQANARPDQAILIFAGDISADKAVALAAKSFGVWKPAADQKSPTLPAITAPAKTEIFLVDIPGAKQCQIRVGQPGITRKDQPDYFVSRLVSDYFGGNFHSRLNDSLRVQKGLTYGSHGGYGAQRFAGQFNIGTFTKNESAAAAVKAIFEEIEKLRTVAPDEKELSRTKSFMAGSFVRNRETPQQVAGDLWLVESNALGNDYFERLLSTVAAASDADCLALAKKTLNPDKMIVVVAGDASALKADLESIAPVTVVTPEKPKPTASR